LAKKDLPESGHRRLEPRPRRGAPVPPIEAAQMLEAIPDGIVIVDGSGWITYVNALLEEMSGYGTAELIGRPVEDLVPDAMRTVHVRHREQFTAQPHTRPMGANLDIHMRRKDGSTFPADIALSPLPVKGGTVILAAIRDATERRRAQSRLAAVVEVTHAIMEGTDPDGALGLIARHARVLIAADLSMVSIPDDAQTFVIRAADGDRAARLLGTRYPTRKSLSGEAYRSGKPINVTDMRAERRAYVPITEAGDLGAALSLPLKAGGRSFGTLLVANHPGGPAFDADQLKVVDLFAAQAAVALEYQNLRNELQRLAIVEDRERIARELHDGVIQALFAVGMNLQATEARADDPQAVRARVNAAVESIDAAIHDLRNYIFGLRPGILADRQLQQALEALAEETQARSDLAVVADIDPRAASLLGNRAVQLVQVAREALSNVVRHAQAQTCRITLELEDEAAVLTIDDDGVGFDAQQSGGGQGQGMRNMRERVEAMGGRFSISGSKDEGSTVRVEIPL
jgi:PAS domain S-box-containing protein